MVAVELLIIVLLAVAIVVVVWLVVRSASGPKRPPVSTARVRGAPSEVVDDLQLALSGLPHTTVDRGGPGSLTVVRQHIPGWAIVLAIIFFPIGLIALLAKTPSTGSVLADADGDTSAMRMAGSFDSRAIDAINRVIEQRSSPEGAVGAAG